MDTDFDVRELHEFDLPYRWALHKGIYLVSKYRTDKEAYVEKNLRTNKHGLYCAECGSTLGVKGVHTIYCPNKVCERNN